MSALGVKRTSRRIIVMSAFDPKRTLSLNRHPRAVRQNALAAGRKINLTTYVFESTEVGRTFGICATQSRQKEGPSPLRRPLTKRLN
jgi:hypothetical protein